MRYSVDTSALIDGWVRYYPKDVFPRVWELMDELIDQKVLMASQEVLRELERKDDSLAAWARDRDMFIPIDAEIQIAVQEILRQFPRLVDTRRDRSGGDPWVIALAKTRDCHVLTGESSTGKSDRPNIPDVCSILRIRCVNLLQMFGDQGWVF